MNPTNGTPINWSKWGVRAIIVGMVLILAVAVAAASEFHAGSNEPDTYSGSNPDLPPGVTQDEVNRVASNMYCDVCEGIPLDECESVTCANWRREIARLLGEGMNRDQIMDYFVERYGDDVAAVPRDAGDRMLAFAMPVILFAIVGGIGLFQVLKLRRRGPQVARRSEAAGKRGARPVPSDTPLVERLEHELEGLSYER